MGVLNEKMCKSCFAILFLKVYSYNKLIIFHNKI
jgi:hypothetical protein